MRGSIFFPEGWGLLGGGCSRDIWIFKFSGGGVRGIFSVILRCEFWIWEFRNLNFRKLNFPGGGGVRTHRPPLDPLMYISSVNNTFFVSDMIVYSIPQSYSIAFEKLSFFANYIWRTVKYFNSSPSKFYRNFIMFKDTLEANILAILSIVRVKSFLCNCFYIMITIYPYSCLIQLFFF